MDNLSLEKPGRARTSSELLLGRFIENPTNSMMLRWSHLLQASGNRLRRKQKSVEGIGDTMRIWLWNIQNHWTKKSFLTLVTRSGQILPPVDTSTEALFLPRSQALSDWYAIVISTKETETAPFIGILQVPKLRDAFQTSRGQRLSDEDWLHHIYEGSNNSSFQYRENA